MRLVPITALPAEDFRVTLDDVPYRITTRWNARGGFGTIDISDDQGVALLAGNKLVPEYPLHWCHPDPRLPAGEFILQRQSRNVGERPALAQMGDEYLLVYVTGAEARAARAGFDQ